MYAQISTRCNHHCEHCMFGCTTTGEDMTLDTFRNALKLFAEDFITLGGGEPTLHPQFRNFLIDAIAASSDQGCGPMVGVVTNGSINKEALLIAKLAQKGVIWGTLSQDEWHDPIDNKIVEAFTKPHKNDYRETHNDCREIRTVNRIISQGRAKSMLEDEEYETTECCGGWHVNPNGDVKGCSCEDAPVLFNVNQHDALDRLCELTMKWDGLGSECWHDCEKMEEVA
jgi:MoaA/NifB/PqqE/SkfB family radical SAM enzyme